MSISISSITTATEPGASGTISVTTSESPAATQVGDLVVVIHGNDFYSLTNMPTPTATGSPTLTSIVNADAGTNNAHLKSYFYYANTSGAQTVSVTESGVHDEEKTLVVIVLHGAASSSPIDGSASNVSATSTATQVCPAISPANADSFVIEALHSGNATSASSYTAPSGTTKQWDLHVNGTLASAGGGTKQLSSSGSTGTFSWTANGGGCPYAAITFAIKTASTATATYPPQRPRSSRPAPFRVARTRMSLPVQAQQAPVAEVVQPRRPRGLLARRAKRIETVRPQLNPPFPVAEVAQPRRLRGLLLRRGKQAQVVRPQVNPPYPTAEVTQPRRLRGLLPRRGRQAQVVPGPVVVAPPAYVPQTVRTRVRLAAVIRRRPVEAVPVQAYPPAETTQPRRFRGWLPRRARPITPVPARAAPVPELAQPRRARGWLFRRGRLATPTPPQVVLTPPAYPPGVSTVGPPLLRRLAARARLWTPPWPSGPAPRPFRVAVLQPSPKPGWVARLLPPRWRLLDELRASWALLLLPPRWRLVRLQPRWVVQHVGTMTISASSKQYVPVIITPPTSNGVAINPTGDAVNMAFLPTNADPQAGDWKTASWDTPGNGNYIIQCLVGPGGTVVLPAGSYTIWVQIIDNPEIPVMAAGTLIVV